MVKDNRSYIKHFEVKMTSGVLVQILSNSCSDARSRALFSVVHYVHDNKKQNNS